MPYHETQNYGINKIIKEYAHFPKLFPLPCHFEHGWIPSKQALATDLKTKKSLMLVRSRRRLIAWRKASKIPAYIFGSPLIHYKNKHHIIPDDNASGTIFFPCHSIFDIDAQYDINDLAQKLKKLPKSFQPITICLFWLDYKKLANEYAKHGFNVVTVGSKLGNSLAFVQNFYRILKMHRYSASNQVGTYSFLAVDFGVPFFLIGKPPLLVNKTGKDENLTQTKRVQDFMYGRYATNIFNTGPVKSISLKQKKFVEKEMDLKEHISPKKLNRLLWDQYKRNLSWYFVIVPYLAWSVAIKTGILTHIRLAIRLILKK